MGKINRQKIISRISEDIEFPSDDIMKTLMEIIKNSKSPKQAVDDVSKIFKNDEDFIVSLYFVGFAVRHILS